jgi:hypothetical protein
MKGTDEGGFRFPVLIARLVLLFLFFSCWNLSLRAQSTAELDGTVTDSTGAAVPNAKVQPSQLR